jgi:enterochelin esterase-like enzyme
MRSMLNRQGRCLGWFIVTAWIMTGCIPQPGPRAASLEQSTNTPRTIPSAGPVGSLLPPRITPIPSLDPAPACIEKRGNVIREQFKSSNLPGTLEYSLYLPPCYTKDRTYPVLYLLHGLTYKDDQWIRLGVVTAADNLISSGKTQSFIIVLPFDYNWRTPPESKFGDALVLDLVPRIEQEYHASRQPGDRAVGGLSRGGGWAYWLMINHPNVFGSIGGHSPALFQKDPEVWLDLIRYHYPEGSPRLWLDAGNADPEINSLTRLHEAFLDEEIRHDWKINDGAHEETYWRQHVSEYLEWYLLPRLDN